MRQKLLTSILVISVFLHIAPLAHASEDAGAAAILFIADVSGSMDNADPRGFWRDAIAMGADLGAWDKSPATIFASPFSAHFSRFSVKYF